MEEPSVGGGAAAADPASGGGTGPGASPWRKATPPPAASAETAVMGAESWPALEEARQKAALESPAKAGPGNAWWRLRKGAAPQGSPPPPPPSQARRPLRLMHHVRVLCSGKENHDSCELTAGWLVGHTFLPVKAATTVSLLPLFRHYKSSSVSSHKLHRRVKWRNS
ncbi:hypothetical protein C2845_PM16G20310 [Panicum miliaceum]|uniref:Uncharacterized protein n=1 Tax=Panicum miliaceum TaxID=4540 RepID=A0A3L6PYN2_PANMI|nr:hypothetical protein C2845_PM16G20310 [Panicum miliaceum]